MWTVTTGCVWEREERARGKRHLLRTRIRIYTWRLLLSSYTVGGHLAIMVKVPSLTVTFNGNCRNIHRFLRTSFIVINGVMTEAFRRAVDATGPGTNRPWDIACGRTRVHAAGPVDYVVISDNIIDVRSVGTGGRRNDISSRSSGRRLYDYLCSRTSAHRRLRRR